MELKSGYQQTEVGVIPAEWEIVRFSDLMDFRNGANADKRAYGEGTPFINVLEVITHTHIRAVDIPGRVSLPKNVIEAYAVRRGDLVFNRTSETQEEVGLSAVYQDDERVIFGGFVIRGRPKTDSLDASYSGYALRAPLIRSQVIAKGQGAIRANVGQADLRQVLAPRPPLPEQRAIAGALGDVDALLGALTRLIARKRDLKQAAMQQLLTGQTRLPRFSGEWKVKRLGEVSAIKTGKKNNDDKVEDGQYPFFVRSHTVERINTYSFDGEAILIPGEGGIGSIFHYVNGRFDYHQRVYKISNFTAEVCGKFVFFCMVQTFSKQAARSSVKATVDSLRLPAFLEFEFLAPSADEQAAIAEVLSDMDADLAALERRLGKTRVLKHGMMQELLTGRTRLV